MAFAKAYKVPDVQIFPRFEQIASSSRSTISSRKKSARELRQRRSDYRCCIPALAGFVSPQSIAPDGGKSVAQDEHRAIEEAKEMTNCRMVRWRTREVVSSSQGLICNSCSSVWYALTLTTSSDYISRVKWLAVILLGVLQTSCTTIPNRRDLYSPQPAPDLDWHRQLVTTTQHLEKTTPSPVNR